MVHVQWKLLANSVGRVHTVRKQSPDRHEHTLAGEIGDRGHWFFCGRLEVVVFQFTGRSCRRQRRVTVHQNAHQERPRRR